MSAYYIINGSNVASVIAPSWNSICKPTRKCCSLHVTDTPSIISRIVHVSEDGQVHEQPSVVTMALPSNWKHAEIATVQIAQDTNVMLLFTWVVVIRQETVSDATENVWIGRYEGTELCSWTSVHVPQLTRKKADTDMEVQILDGPVFCFHIGQILVLVNSKSESSSTPYIESNLDVEKMLCPIVRGVARKEILCVGRAKDASGSFERNTLYTISTQNSTAHHLGALSPVSISDLEDNYSIIQCAVVDIYENVLIIVWSNGFATWHDFNTLKRFRAEQLPPEAGPPIAAALVRGFSTLFITCLTNKNSSKPSENQGNDMCFDTQVWAIKIGHGQGQRHVACCFSGAKWKGRFKKSDILLMCERVVKGKNGVDDKLVAVQYREGSQKPELDESCVLSISQSDVPWRDFDDSANFVRLRQVEHRLQKRLRAGINALVEATVIADEKYNMTEKARSLLHALTDDAPVSQSSKVFSKLLGPVVESTGVDRRNDVDMLSTLDQYELEESDRSSAPLETRVPNNDEIVRLLQLEHFVDSSRNYFVVAVDAIILEEAAKSVTIQTRRVQGPSPSSRADHDDKCCPRVCLEVQVGRDLNPVWEATSVKCSRNEFRTTLMARINLFSLLNSCVTGLSELAMEVRAISSDEREQTLAILPLDSDIFGPGISQAKVSIPPWCIRGYDSFSERAEIVARGANAAGLRSCNVQDDEAPGGVRVNVAASESVAEVIVEAPNGVALAAIASRLLEHAPDDVSLEMAVLTVQRVSALERAASSFMKELECAERSVGQHPVSLADFKHLLEQQMATDEAFGHLHESFAGVL